MIDLRRIRTNTQRRFGSAGHYHVGYVVDVRGELRQGLFTDDDVHQALARGELNTEDLPPITWQVRLLTWLWQLV